MVFFEIFYHVLYEIFVKYVQTNINADQII